MIICQAFSHKSVLLLHLPSVGTYNVDSTSCHSFDCVVLHFLLQKEEFQHTAYSTNAYVTIGPFARQLLHGKEATFQNIPYNLEFQMMLLF